MPINIFQVVLKGILLQTLLLVLTSLILSSTISLLTGGSFLLGGLVCLIPTLLFSKIFFKNSGAKAARKIVNSFYAGEIIKLSLTIVLFIISFHWQELRPLPFFLGFIFTQMIYWLISVKQV